MPESCLGWLRIAIDSFGHAKRAVEATFQVQTAPEIVTSVLAKKMPREGRCFNGWEYFVHGVGYTVVLPSGAEVHIDGSSQGDCFSVYDILSYVESAGGPASLSVEDVNRACQLLCDRGELFA